ncbi:MAG: hypothetical protein GWN67_02540 [Phycisphaerae bacterium]|nr:hypothetical protein [Phycisphaerae bacterium]NIP52073.1 hypothetical protein [Phycisphaerae bacterium]NIS50038.1 hypothetical protein [Phycisphaerae bacterium]NIU10293.1 hypothetical protein [Phycisphaerae bacterium]NIU55304.1 hypothetical protein [Phycisphaerae bacterium]
MKQRVRWSYEAGIAGWRLNKENGLFQADDSAAHAGFLSNLNINVPASKDDIVND